MKTKNKFLKFFRQLFCNHKKWAYNYNKGYHRCKYCGLKIEEYENN